MSLPFYMMGKKSKDAFGRDFIGGKSSWNERQSPNGNGTFLAFRRELLEELSLLESPYGIAPNRLIVDWNEVKRNSPSHSFKNVVLASTKSDKSKLNNWFKEHKHSDFEGSITVKIRYLYSDEKQHYQEFYLTPHSPEDFKTPYGYSNSMNQYFIDVQHEFYSHDGSLASYERMCREIFGEDIDTTTIPNATANATNATAFKTNGYGDIDVSGDRLACGIIKRMNIPDESWNQLSDCYDEGRLLNTIWDEYYDRAIGLARTMDNPTGTLVERIKCKKMKSHINSHTVPAECYDQEYWVDIIRVTGYAYKVEISLVTNDTIDTNTTATTLTNTNTNTNKAYCGVLVCENRLDHQKFAHNDDNREHRGFIKFAKVFNHQLFKVSLCRDGGGRDGRKVFYGEHRGGGGSTDSANNESSLSVFIDRVLEQMQVEIHEIALIDTGREGGGPHLTPHLHLRQIRVRMQLQLQLSCY